MKVTAELSVIPITGDVSFSNQIAKCERILKNHECKLQLHSEGTNIEGELDNILSAIQECIESAHDNNIPRLFTNIKINSRTDKQESFESKIQSVESKIGSI